MAKLHQLIAIQQDKKSRAEKALETSYKKIQVEGLFKGMVKTYKPLDEEGETLPNDEQIVQYTVEQAVNDFKEPFIEGLDITLTQDVANCNAKANIEVNGTVVLKDVPVTHLLILEKRLVDLHTFVKHIPTLDPAKRWDWDSNVNSYVAGPDKTNRNKKVMKNHVLATATDKHPAQVQVYTEDEKIGEYETKYFSGAIKVQTKQKLLERVLSLQDAVKVAREYANEVEITTHKEGETLLNFIFEPLKSRVQT